MQGVHNMRQAQTQQNIQNFYRHDFNILNPRVNVMHREDPSPPYRYELPIMQWSVALVYKMTGESFLVTRIMMFLIGMASVVGMYFLLKYLLGNPLAAMAGAFAFNFSPIFYYYTVCPMPDNLALCGTICALAFLFKYKKTEKYIDAHFSAFFLSLSIAAKLPFIIFAVGPAYYILTLFIRKDYSQVLRLGLIYLLWFLPAFAWYAWVIPTWNNGVIAGILDNQIGWDETFKILDYHLNITLPKRVTSWGTVPFVAASVFFMFKYRTWRKENFKIIALAGLTALAYWIYEFNMIGTVHDYYLFPILPFIYILVGYGISKLLMATHWIKWVFLAFLATLPSFAFNYMEHSWTVYEKDHNVDAFKYKEDLRAAVPDTSLCIILNDPSRFVFSYLINKRGQIFEHDDIQAAWMNDLIKNRGIHYMYSNSRVIDENPDFTPFLDSLIMERGKIRVYKLKPN